MRATSTFARCANRRGGFLRHDAASASVSVAASSTSSHFGEFVVVAPDVAHFLARVAWNQCLLPK